MKHYTIVRETSTNNEMLISTIYESDDMEEAYARFNEYDYGKREFEEEGAVVTILKLVAFSTQFGRELIKFVIKNAK